MPDTDHITKKLTVQELSDILVLHSALVSDGSGGLGNLLNVVALNDDLILDVGERP